MKVVVIYHAGCWDGFCCAWLYCQAFPLAEFVPAHHGDDPPEVDKETAVYIADFSYPRDVLLDLARRAKFVVLHDHHKTAKDDLRDLPDDDPELAIELFFEMDKSGGRMVWEYLHPKGTLRQDMYRCTHNDPHWLVTYTEDRDLWRHNLPDTKLVNAALRSYELEFAVWDWLSSLPAEQLIPEGQAILRYRDKLVEQHTRFAAPVTIEGHTGLAVNCTAGDIQSEVAGALAENSGTFGATWVDRVDDYLWSLRSRGEFDVSEIAKSMGGGGHKNAAGFKTTAHL